MPRIRKKTSKRGTTHQRQKIKHKVAECHHKKKQLAKKNPQWKTKHPKDPGIPNNFPYKDQILAEIAEERRQAEEAKQQKKDAKKAAKAAAAGGIGGGEEDRGEEGEEEAFDGVGSVKSGQRLSNKKKVAVVGEVEEDVPILLNPDLPNLKSVLDQADVVVEVLDARDPLPYRNSHLEKLVSGKRLLLVLNKADACPRETLANWRAYLRSQHSTLLFRSASAFLPSASDSSAKWKGKDKAPTDDGLGVDSVLACLGSWAKQKEGDSPLVVAIVGLVNSGKSAFVNSLLRKQVLPLYQLSTSSPQNGPTTTTSAQEVTLDVDGKSIRLIDTPGLAWAAVEDQPEAELHKARVRDILIRNKGRIDRLKDPEPAVADIVSRADHEDLMVFFNLPAFIQGDVNGFLSGVARTNGLIKNNGILDIQGAARIVLRDWSTGKLPRYSVPPPLAPGSSVAVDDILRDVYAREDQILSQFKTRKEMRTERGLVKLTAGSVEMREVVLDAPWVGGQNDESDEDDEESENEMDVGADGEDLVEDDEEDEDEMELELDGLGGDGDDDGSDQSEDSEDEAPVLTKRKRKLSSKPSAKTLPQPKKVAFAALPKESKQSRVQVKPTAGKASHPSAQRRKAPAKQRRK
ncbi:hypothetical protein JAAARDRAFT_167869 [Jaapia argillacea MUCL 33604]|uniref:CP-type G domain-containing protein n=1 Tax=Jaapia argillacea MUCL 33604 TaxID=933084 RepID=A0A067QDL4_9AGAM|nr:hypothetical protein JAAARDRAFT_167869 [Jaapia argillacea MUCL 33604]